MTLAGYFRLRGEVEALGIVSVSIELYLEMRYESASGKCVGTATISIEIDVTFSARRSRSAARRSSRGRARSDAGRDVRRPAGCDLGRLEPVLRCVRVRAGG